MDVQKVDFFLMTNSKYFESYQINTIREKLLQFDESRTMELNMIQFREPAMMLVVSLLGGTLGIDRFVLGDVGLGIGKLLTCGGLGIWTIVDWFLIMGRTKEVNYNKLMMIL